MTRSQALRTVQRLREVLGARDWTPDELRQYSKAAGVLK